MGIVVDGRWQISDRKPSGNSRFIRAETHFRNRIEAGGETEFPATPGRYHLYVSWACPWAHRTLILRSLKKLEQVISLSVVDPLMGEMGWAFSANAGCIPDGVNGKQYLHEVYLLSDPAYGGRASVPVLWDRQRACIVNNESREIMRMFDHAFGELAGDSMDYCPPDLQETVERTIDQIYHPINNGVYRCGFARTQEAYEEAVTELFDALEHWEQVLAQQRYLCGDRLTEADWCLFPTLLRFDPVYHFHFKCNRQRLRDFPNLWDYTRELFQVPGVAETCNMAHIKQHYYWSHETINPTRIVPLGPDNVDFSAPHTRERSYFR